eukprot:5596297-Alexandrium_andersonii.AAC.1
MSERGHARALQANTPCKTAKGVDASRSHVHLPGAAGRECVASRRRPRGGARTTCDPGARTPHR